MARKILSIWPCHIIFPIPQFHMAEDQGELLKQKQGGKQCHNYRIKHKTKVIFKSQDDAQLLKCPNHAMK